MSVKPESVGMCSSRLARIDRFLSERYVAAGRLPVRKPENDLRGLVPSPGWDCTSSRPPWRWAMRWQAGCARR